MTRRFSSAFLSVITLLILFTGHCGFAADADAIRDQLKAGGFVVVGNEFDRYDIRSFIDIGKSRVTVRCVGFNVYDSRSFAKKGARLLIGQPFDRYDIRSIIQAAPQPSLITVFAKGYDHYDLKSFTDLGASLDVIDEDQGTDNELDVYDIRDALKAGKSVTVGNRFDHYDIRSFLEIGRERVTVVSKGFDRYDCRDFAERGASMILSQPLDRYDIRSILEKKNGSAKMTVVADGFDRYDLKSFAELGANIDY